MKTICASIREYLTVRRALGYKLRITEKHLRSFATFLRRKRSSRITAALALEWATASPSGSRQQHCVRLSAVRRFAEYRKVADPKTEIPPAHILPYRSNRGTVHIYTSAEIRAVMRAFRSAYPTRFKNQTLTTVFGLLSATGCRSGEVLRLSCADVDFKHKRLVIRFGKNDKQRLVPLHATTVKALRRYERQRNRFFRHPGTFFVSLAGTPVAYSELERGFVRVSKKIGLRAASAKHGPRVHDLRHTFAVKTILRWYKQNLPVEAQLPILSAYLGHIKPSDTYWYLTGVPELLALAAKRLPNLRS